MKKMKIEVPVWGFEYPVVPAVPFYPYLYRYPYYYPWYGYYAW